jgi:protein SCO1
MTGKKTSSKECIRPRIWRLCRNSRKRADVMRIQLPLFEKEGLWEIYGIACCSSHLKKSPSFPLFSKGEVKPLVVIGSSEAFYDTVSCERGQRWGLRYFFTHLVLIMTLLAPAFQAGAHEEEKVPLTEITIEQRLNAQVPLDLIFTDETGHAGALDRYFDGKPVLLALVYYDCPQLCPLVLDGLARSLRPLDLKAGSDYRVIAVSIDPRETPELARTKKHALMERSRPEVAAGWHFLTGDQLSIESLAQTAGFRYVENEKEKQDRYVHAVGTIALTPEGKISRYFYGFDYPPRDLRLALVEASGNRIGSAVDQLLLLCYKYDPTQGKYTLSILNLLRFSATATVLVLGGFLMLMLRRERKLRTDRPARDKRTR